MQDRDSVGIPGLQAGEDVKPIQPSLTGIRQYRTYYAKKLWTTADMGFVTFPPLPIAGIVKPSPSRYRTMDLEVEIVEIVEIVESTTLNLRHRAMDLEDLQ